MNWGSKEAIFQALEVGVGLCFYRDQMTAVYKAVGQLAVKQT